MATIDLVLMKNSKFLFIFTMSKFSGFPEAKQALAAGAVSLKLLASVN